MTDELKLGLYSVRDDTSILGIQSSDLNAYIFSTRDDPALFDASNAGDDLVEIFRGSVDLTDIGQGMNQFAITLEGYNFTTNKDVTELFVTIDGTEYVLPKSTETISEAGKTIFFGDFNGNDPPAFDRYPIAMMTLIPPGNRFAGYVPNNISSIVLKAHRTEIKSDQDDGGMK